jgi:hypothetical protein
VRGREPECREHAEAAPTEALTLHAHGGRPFDAARTEIRHGQTLRRRRRRTEASALRAAVEAFDRLGLAAWAALAQAELRATGGTSSRSWASPPAPS